LVAPVPTNEVLGFLFGVSDSTASRILSWLIPLLEASGKDTMRMPDPGRKHRKELDALLKETPELAVIIDTAETPRQRSACRGLVVQSRVCQTSDRGRAYD
jgi:hypothetical protein